MQSNKNTIDNLYWKYLRQATALLATLFFATLLVAIRFPSVVFPLVVSAIYSLVVEIAAVVAWRKVTEKSPESMPTLLMGISGGRFMLALVVMFVYFLLVGKTGRGDMMTFVLVFAVFYLSAILHHTLFFTHRNKANAEKKQ